MSNSRIQQPQQRQTYKMIITIIPCRVHQGIEVRGQLVFFSGFLPDFCPEVGRQWVGMDSSGVQNHPEQVSGRVVDSRTDLCAACFFFVLVLFCLFENIFLGSQKCKLFRKYHLGGQKCKLSFLRLHANFHFFFQ